MALPVKLGTQLIAHMVPGARSLNALGFTAANGFVASSSATTADRVDLFNADENATSTGYRSLSLIATAGSSQWLATAETSSIDLSNAALIKPMRASFIKSTNAKPGFMIPVTWRP
jgi:hypothetical protein